MLLPVTVTPTGYFTCCLKKYFRSLEMGYIFWKVPYLKSVNRRVVLWVFLVIHYLLKHGYQLY